MAKRKITKQQNRRIQQRQQQHIDNQQPTSVDDANTFSGTVISHQGKLIQVEDESGNVISCHMRTHIEKPVCGDQVIWQSDDYDNSGVFI